MNIFINEILMILIKGIKLKLVQQCHNLYQNHYVSFLLLEKSKILFKYLKVN
jgi:hypothetical protein